MVVNPEIFILFGSSNLLVIQNVWALKSLEDSKRPKQELPVGGYERGCFKSIEVTRLSKLRVCRSCAFFEVKRLRAIRLTFRTWLHLRRKDNL